MADGALAPPAAPPAGSSRLRQGLARHWLFGLLLAAGIAMRVIVSIGYRPIFIYFDSLPYLTNADSLAPRQTRPVGYPLVLRSLLWIHDLTAVAVLQHVMGLVIAGLVYAVLLRYGAPAWAAALGAAPALLDAYQLNIEHYVMSDTTSELLITIALVVLVWGRTQVGLVAAAVAGFLLGIAGWVRTDTLIMVAPALIYLLLRERTWIRRLQRVALLLLCFLLPVLGYATWYQQAQGAYALSGQTGHWLYGRVAPFANCKGMQLKPYERELCPTGPESERTGSNCFVWCSTSPARTFRPPDGEDRDTVLRKFAIRIIEHQPWDYTRHVVSDVVYGFSPTHSKRPKDVTNVDSKFSASFPDESNRPPSEVVRQYGNDGTHVVRGIGHFMEDYQKVVYAPGTLLAALMLIGLLASTGIGRARRSGLRAVSLLFSLGGLMIVLPAALVSEFVWRYQLPQSILLPIGGVLGLTALLRKEPEQPQDVEVPTAVTVPSGS